MQDSSGALVAQLRHYMSRGWALVPLHDVSSGTCSCRAGAECRTPGKHPRTGRGWQRPENLVRTDDQLLGAMGQWPSSNWGLATGLISGVWALDYDPKAVDPGRAGEVNALLAECWAAATWVQRTGSGGLHFLFTLPLDFVPNNSDGRLPPGFDVRGARRGEPGGGQIVIAPSVSGVGPYEVLCDTAVTHAPGSVLEAVRPAPPRTPSPATSFAPVDSDMAGSYVAAAVNGELAELRECWTGRNQRAWRAAARCVEMINTGLVDAEAAYGAWWAAGLAHPDVSVTVPERELLQVWASAERHVGDRPADLSGVGGPSSWGGDAIHFAGAPAAPPLLGGGPGAALGQGPAQPVHNPVDSDSDAVSAQVMAVPDPVAALLAEMLDVDALRNIVPPQPLINGVLDLDTTAWLIGESGSYKSFVALDLAAHVALGRQWHGYDVHRGDVVYIVAEGARGMKLRVDAWEREHGTLKGVWFLPRPVQANDMRGWGVLVEACARLAPALVVIDTQARVTLGLEENSNTDMGQYVAAVDAVRRATAACVLTVHHTGRDGRNARGASALDGAQDAELKVERVDNQPYTVRLIMDKQKDQPQGEPMTLRLRRSEGGSDPLTGRDLSSLVVGQAGVSVPEPQGGIPAWRRNALELFKIMHGLFGQGGTGETKANIGKLFKALPELAELTPSARSTAFYEAWIELTRRGRVMRYGSSARCAAFLPPDGAGDGWITINTGEPDDMPPDGWQLDWPEADRQTAEAARISGIPRLYGK